MSVHTEKQKAYHFRKMRTRFTRLDLNKDGYISREDYELMAKRLAENGKVTKEQADSLYKACMDIADSFNLKEGVKFPLVEAAKKATEVALSLTPERIKEIVYKGPIGILFDVIDLNNDECISPEELTAYFKVIAPEMTEADVTKTFAIIDTNKNGEISREEFLHAAEDFFYGFEETEVSSVFIGPLVD